MRDLNSYDCSVEVVNSLKSSFVGKESQLRSKLAEKGTFIGFDGYVDKLCSLVSQREAPDNFTRMEQMNIFAERVGSTAGSSCNVERVLKKKIAGGFAPNIARALANLGATVNLVAMLGFPNPEPLFEDFPENVLLQSIGDPGETIALEFDDGKVMLTDFGNINGLSWDKIVENVGRDILIDLCESCDAIGQGHWALVPQMNDFWARMQAEILPSISAEKLKDTLILVDPADMKKRSTKDIREMVDLLRRFEDYGMRACLTLNDKEAVDITNSYNSLSPITDRDAYIDAGLKINAETCLSFLVIHDPHFATITTSTKHYYVQEGFTTKPKFTTAAGDHFNGGLLAGLLLGFTPSEAITIANAVTALFVRTGNSPDLTSTGKFLSMYEQFVDQDIPTWPIS